MGWYVPHLGYQENVLPLEQMVLGHDVEIITSSIFPESCRDVPFLKIGDWQSSFSIGKHLDGPMRITRLRSLHRGSQVLLLGLRRALSDSSPDVVVAHGAFSPATMQVILNSRSIGYRVFVDDHSLGLGHSRTSVSNDLYLALCRRFYGRFRDRVVLFLPVTLSAKRVLQSEIRVPDEKCELLPLGANTEVFRHSDSLRASRRRELQLDNDEFIVISTGKLLPEKKMTLLIEAFAQVATDKERMKLLIVGSGPADYIQEIMSTAERLGVRESLILRDFVPNDVLPSFYNAADLGVWPGLPSITVIEAAATGLPVILPASEVSYQVLYESSAAHSFGEPELESLVDALRRLVENPSMRSSLSVNAMRVASETLSWKHIARRSINLFESRPG